MATTEIKNKFDINEIKVAVTEVAKQYGVERVYLFGSVARGDFSADSDIDVRIDSGQITSLFQLGGFIADLEEKLGGKVDVATSESSSDNFLNRIKKDEVLLYEKT